MRGLKHSGFAIVSFALVCCIVAAALPAWSQEEPGTAAIPTIYRDSWKVTVNGRPQVNGTFTMVFKPLNGEPVEFTVNVVAKMKPKQISQDLWKELSLAAGVNYKVKKKGDKVVAISKANKKVPGIALEITEQKLSGMSLTISAD
jgi:hypothetical protein